HDNPGEYEIILYPRPDPAGERGGMRLVSRPGGEYVLVFPGVVMSENTAELAAPAPARRELLFVDDDPLIVESLSLALQDQYVVYSAESRKQAKELLHRMKNPPSLALVDLGLPPRPHKPD